MQTADIAEKRWKTPEADVFAPTLPPAAMVGYRLCTRETLPPYGRVS
jgi:hypothetical protein